MFAQFHITPSELPDKLNENPFSIITGKLNGKQLTIYQFDEKGVEYVIPCNKNIQILNVKKDSTIISEYEKKYIDDKLDFIETIIYDNFICSIVDNDKLYNLNSQLFNYNLSSLDDLKQKYPINDFIFIKTTKKNAELIFFQDLSFNKIFIPKIGLANIQQSNARIIYTTTGELINLPNKPETFYLSDKDNYSQLNEIVDTYTINNVQLILFGLKSSSIEECEKQFKLVEYFEENKEKSISDIFKLFKEIKTENDFLLKSGLLLNIIKDFAEKEESYLPNNNISIYTNIYKLLIDNNTFKNILEKNDYENFKRIIFQIKINTDSLINSDKNHFIPYKYNIEKHLENKFTLSSINKKSEPIQTAFIHLQNNCINKDLWLE